MSKEIFICRDYVELLQRGAKLFGNALFLENKEEKVSFKKFYENILRIANGEKFRLSNSLILDVEDQLLFSQAYFAGVITGHLVFLGNKYSRTESITIVKDDDIRKYLKNSPIDEKDIPEQNLDLPCTVAFSSGTTSKNKGVLLSQRNLIYDSAFSTKNFRFDVGERLVHILPFQHLFGLVADLITSLLSGSCMYIVDSPLLFLYALRYFKPHCVNMPPALADMLCTAIKNSNDISSVTGGCLKRVLCAGAPMKESTFYELQEYGILPGMAYGLTECSPCISITKGNDVRCGTSGIPIDCVDVQISDDGEVLVSGDTVMKGYLDGSESSKIIDGYFHTGDIGYIDANGHLVISGRISTMIVFSNGKKCMPEIIEGKINSVIGVEECLLRSARNGTVAELIVVTNNKEIVIDAIEKVMKDEDIYPFLLKIQHEKLPRNTTGKVLRNEI